MNNFLGRGWSDSVSVAVYGSFTQGGFYADALAGYAYFNNQLQRQIMIPGLATRTASGSAGANQFLGQVETGYRLGVYAPAAATMTPFGRLQASSVTQNAFSEWGANSLSLNVAQQTTNSLRTTLGADLAGAIELGNERKLDLALRLGWLHEFADTARPITAAFAGAPGNSFTVFGATPRRDAAVHRLVGRDQRRRAHAIYMRYDGDIAGGTDNHAINVGVRFDLVGRGAAGAGVRPGEGEDLAHEGADRRHVRAAAHGDDLDGAHDLGIDQRPHAQARHGHGDIRG